VTGIFHIVGISINLPNIRRAEEGICHISPNYKPLQIEDVLSIVTRLADRLETTYSTDPIDSEIYRTDFV